MTIVQAYKCDETGKLFDITDKKSYLSHMRKMIAKRKRVEKELKRKQEFMDLIHSAQQTVSTVQELLEFFFNNPTVLHKNCMAQDKIYVNDNSFKFLGLKFKGIHKLEASNSHGAPSIGVTNWTRENHLPVGYSGLYGRLEFAYLPGKHNIFPSRHFDNTGIYLGSGGGGIKMNPLTGMEFHSFSCSATIWLDDWVGIANGDLFDHLNKCLVNKLAGRSTPEFVVEGQVGDI